MATNRTPWTQEEDDVIRNSGSTMIAHAKMPHRTADSIRGRAARLRDGWQPRMRKVEPVPSKRWTHEEDMRLLALINEHGPDWRLIEKQMGRAHPRNRAYRMLQMPITPDVRDLFLTLLVV